MKAENRGPAYSVLSRRSFATGALFAPLLGAAALADTVIELSWHDLLPEGQPPMPDVLTGLLEHQNAPLASLQPESTGVRDDWNGKTVTLPGYLVPLDFDGIGVTSFLLVPYVGACIHVPPPPANQLVLVTTEKPYLSSGLFEAVSVTGSFGVHSLSTDLAQIGYAMTAGRVAPYEG